MGRVEWRDRRRCGGVPRPALPIARLQRPAPGVVIGSRGGRAGRTEGKGRVFRAPCNPTRTLAVGATDETISDDPHLFRYN